jgi:hypothetical protein
MYAYSRINNELVRAVREKGCFTSNRETEYASAGAYYFKSSKKLQDALEWQVEDKLEVQNEHYVSLAIEAMLKRMPQSAVRVFEIPKFCQWGTPDDLKTFEYWEKTFTSWNKLLGDPSSYEVSQILMPMAVAFRISVTNQSRFSKSVTKRCLSLRLIRSRRRLQRS